MQNNVLNHNYFVGPGYVCLPATPLKLCAVVSFGIAVTLFDSVRRFGGMAHYTLPYRKKSDSTTRYAGPSIVSLMRMFFSNGSIAGNLEACMFGGALNLKATGSCVTNAADNIKVGKELLQKFGVKICGSDIGGSCGRKIVFDSTTGKTILARVKKLRGNDWL